MLILNLWDKIDIVANKYIPGLIEYMKDPDFGDINQSSMHTEFIHRCCRGDMSAKSYVLAMIKGYIQEHITPQDRQLLANIVKKEYEYLINGNFPKYEGDKISFYQLINQYSSNDVVSSINLSSINGIEELIEYIYAVEYGLDYIEPLMDLLLNNIEVHDTACIRVQTYKGEWKTIDNYHFKLDNRVLAIARRLLNQDNTADLTEENCEMEGSLLNGARLSVLLKPAAKGNFIFIKRFDTYSASIQKMIEDQELTAEMVEDLCIYAKGRANVAIIGGINTGKTTFMKAYIGLIPDEYKIGLIENDFEAKIDELYPQKDIVTLRETDKFSLNDQFIKQLRTNRDILAIGEVRSYEVEQMIKAMTRGNDGSFTTCHSRTCTDLINNLAWMCLENGIAQDIRILRYRIASAIDIVIRLRYKPVNSTAVYAVDEISEIIAVDDNLDMPYKINTIYKWSNKLGKPIKIGKISNTLIEKFRYYRCSEEELQKINGNVVDDKCLR